MAVPDTCKSVDLNEAGRALGAPIVRVTTRQSGGALMCSFRARGMLEHLNVTTVSFGSIGEAKTQYKAMTTGSMTFAAPSLDIAGVGDEAHRLGPDLYVRKGTSVYVFGMMGREGNGAGAARTLAFAKATVTRLR